LTQTKSSMPPPFPVLLWLSSSPSGPRSLGVVTHLPRAAVAPVLPHPAVLPYRGPPRNTCRHPSWEVAYVVSVPLHSLCHRVLGFLSRVTGEQRWARAAHCRKAVRAAAHPGQGVVCCLGQTGALWGPLSLTCGQLRT
jgi:hypothetical protein